MVYYFFFSSRRRHTRCLSDWSSDVCSSDLRTGKKRWIFHTVPRKGEKGYETWLNGSADYTGSVGVWGPFSADPELGYVRSEERRVGKECRSGETSAHVRRTYIWRHTVA